jgi:hypothetical protein
MSRPRPAACLATLLALAVPLAGCGGGGGEKAASPAGGGAAISMSELASSVEAQAESFLQRDGSALHKSLVRFLGGEIAAEVSPGDTECRSGRNTAAIADPEKFPFACIVQGSADGRGLTVNVTLGFVGLGIDGRCWKAANERVAVTATAPALLTRREAMQAVNRIAGCA